MSNSPDDSLDRVFHALADPTRRKMLELLREEELTLSQLAEPFAMTLPAILKHLHVLSDAGLIEHYKSGRVRHCRREEGPIFDATVWLSKQSKYWQSQFETLAAFLSLQSNSIHKGEPNELRHKARATQTAGRADERPSKEDPRSQKSPRARKGK